MHNVSPDNRRGSAQFFLLRSLKARSIASVILAPTACKETFLRAHCRPFLGTNLPQGSISDHFFQFVGKSFSISLVKHESAAAGRNKIRNFAGIGANDRSTAC